MADSLSPEQQEMFKGAFALFDKDGNGFISKSELGDVLRSLGQNPTDEEVQEMIRQVDTDKSGTVDFKEFLNMIAYRLNQLS